MTRLTGQKVNDSPVASRGHSVAIHLDIRGYPVPAEPVEHTDVELIVVRQHSELYSLAHALLWEVRIGPVNPIR